MLAEKGQLEPVRGRRVEEPAPVAVVETLDTLAGDEEVTADAGGDTDWRE